MSLVYSFLIALLGIPKSDFLCFNMHFMQKKFLIKATGWISKGSASGFVKGITIISKSPRKCSFPLKIAAILANRFVRKR